MNSISLYEYPGFKGESTSSDVDIPDLSSVGFLKHAQSLKIRGESWIAFFENNYNGEFICLQEGEYNSIPGLDNKISSVRCVKGGLYNPKITLFEDCAYGGRSVTLEKAASSLKSYSFDNTASSYKVLSGVWKLYPEEYYKGCPMVCISGDEIPDYCVWKCKDWDNKTSSVKPVLAYDTSK